MTAAHRPFVVVLMLIVATSVSARPDAEPKSRPTARIGDLPRLPVPALRKEWAIDLLAPLLEDKHDTRYTYAIVRGQNEPRAGIRICDWAAQAISAGNPDMPFLLEGNHAALDEQIRAMQVKIAARPL